MKILKNINRNVKLKNNLNLKEIYSLELTDMEVKSGGAIGANLW